MRPSSYLSLILATVGAVAAAGVPRTARAQAPQEQQLAQALFDEGRRLMDQKKYPEACPKLAESQRLDPGAGTLLNLALCHEKEGKVATAQSEYSESLALATRDGRQDRQKIARERLAVIDRVVPRLTITVAQAASEVDGLELKLDGLVIRRAAWGVATPVDPGTHVVEANAPGRTPWSGSVALEASQKKSIDVPVILPLAPLPVQAGAGVANSSSQPQPYGQTNVVAPATLAPPVYYEQATSPSTMLRPRGPASPVFYTTLAVTLVAGTAAAITGYVALSENATAKEGCLPDRKYCRSQSTIDAADSASSYAWASTVSLGVAAAGAIVLLILPSRLSSRDRSVGASSVPGGAVLDLHGTF